MIMFKTPSYTCELPNPVIGDTSDGLRGVNIKVSRGGTLRFILDTSINSKESSNYTLTNLQFQNVPLSKIEDFEKLLRHAAGERTTYVDYNGVEWQCSFDLGTFEYSSAGRFKSRRKTGGSRYIYYDDLGYDFQVTIKKWR